jgi:hypothetical protein
MFRSYDHHQAEKYIATLGLVNWQRIKTHIIQYHMRNRMQTPQNTLRSSLMQTRLKINLQQMTVHL